ncbi:MAG: CinA family protein [Deltaproteobacteria bacterium]|nr:CinA family protein [Deltaproteobacteria bacterium]MBW2414400.1 CinA family protein [Deltaproteobacteria bacterium]
MERLMPSAQRIGDLLRERRESVSVGEGSCGGLISAALVAVPGASGFYVAGAVLYTRPAFEEILREDRYELKGLRGSTEPFSLALARLTREKFRSTWAIGESGASGPSGNRYGDAAGHAALAVAGPVEKTRLLETGQDERAENMWRFAEAALSLFEEALAEAAS